jgi:hypothetical protein
MRPGGRCGSGFGVRSHFLALVAILRLCLPLPLGIFSDFLNPRTPQNWASSNTGRCVCAHELVAWLLLYSKRGGAYVDDQSFGF